MARAKSKTEQVEVVASTSPQPETVSEEKTATSVETEPNSEESVASEQPYRVVVCAYAGTEDLIAKAWKKMCDEPILIIPIAEGDDDARAILTTVIANSDVSDDFVFVKANTIPCSRVTMIDLSVPVVYLDRAGKEHYSHRLPMPLNKGLLVEAFGAEDYPDADETDESFLRSYAETNLSRPIQVSHYFGNYVTIVLRGNPCNAVVAEGLLRRKFLSANAVGFKAIEPFVETLLSK